MSADVAWEEAVKAVRELEIEELAAGREMADFLIEIYDQSGLRIGEVRFKSSDKFPTHTSH